MYLLKGEGRSKKRIFFVNVNNNLALSLATHRSFSLKKAGFPYEIRLQRSPNFDIVAAILNSTQQPGHVFVMLFRPRDFVQMASDKSFNYHSALWILLSRIILSQTCSKLRK